MSLIKSISGIRGTIGGQAGEGLSPLDVVRFTAAYAQWLLNDVDPYEKRIVVGRDARISGEMVNNIVCGTLSGMGFDVIDLGLSTTPTVEVAVPELKACGGIILTASHNPKHWNALKLLNAKGEFISAEEGAKVLALAENEDITFAEVDALGRISRKEGLIDFHIQEILKLELVDAEAVANAGFSVAVDAVNSTGGISILPLLEALGVKTVYPLNCDPSGIFAHNPEPLAEHLTDICRLVKEKSADVGFVVDPDVDRLAMVSENGDLFGEEYTLVAISDYILSHTKGNTVSNMSSTRALRDVTEKHGGSYSASAVGEVNVVAMMKETNAIIGGEGNGGIIYPELHYGRDALVGIALFLTMMAKRGQKPSEIKSGYPAYSISKNKISLQEGMDVDGILKAVSEKYNEQPQNTIDGVKIEFDNEWVHLRKSNTEPIIRIYSESENLEKANELAEKIMIDIREIADL